MAFLAPEPIRGRHITLGKTLQDTTVELSWIIRCDAPMTTRPDPEALSGMPERGDALDGTDGLYLQSWDVSENDDASWTATATYASKDKDDGTGNAPGAGEESEEVTMSEEARSWSGTRTSTDLICDANDTTIMAVLPSGEPFQSVPQISLIGKKVSITRKVSAENPGNWMKYDGTINKNAVTIDGYTIPAHCGLLSVSAERIYNDTTWTWRITMDVEIRRKSVSLEPGAAETELGHDEALLLQAFKVKATTGANAGKFVKAQAKNPETDAMEDVQAPVLINAEGEQYTPSDSDPYSAYYKKFTTYKEATWNASWFVAPAVTATESTTE